MQCDFFSPSNTRWDCIDHNIFQKGKKCLNSKMKSTSPSEGGGSERIHTGFCSSRHEGNHLHPSLTASKHVGHKGDSDFKNTRNLVRPQLWMLHGRGMRSWVSRGKWGKHAQFKNRATPKDDCLKVMYPVLSLTELSSGKMERQLDLPLAY